MRIQSRARFGDQIQTLFSVGVVRDLSDGQLLERFATVRDEVAELSFAVLVERHGPMVLRVCRGILNDPNDRDDAFQATFLILVKKARGLWVRDSLGPWLHQVAFRAATSLKSSAARRRRLENLAVRDSVVNGGVANDNLGPVLHEEIERLPERFRVALILCDLEGRSHEQAARHLGWPIGTVKSRQSRGRERLRERLLRRGITADAGRFAFVLPQNGFNASIPRALMESTTRAAVGSLTRQSIASGTAAALAQGVLRSMFMTYWLKVATVIVGVGVTASGVGSFIGRDAPGDERVPRAAPVDQPVPNSPHDESRSIVIVPGKLKITVTEPAVIEAARRSDVYCKVEGSNTTILSIVPEGSLVNMGQVVCELDSSMLNDTLTNQVITTKGAEAAFQNAKLARQEAEVAKAEYVEGDFKSERGGLKGEAAAARMAIAKAEARLERTLKARRKLGEWMKSSTETLPSVVADLDLADRIDAAELTIAREKMVVEIADYKLSKLEKHTFNRTANSLAITVEKAKSNEMTKQATWDLEKTKEAKLRRQIENCRIIASFDGMVFHARDLSRNKADSPSEMKKGSIIRPRQKIFTLFDRNGPFLVSTKVPERVVDRLVPGLGAKVFVDAIPDQTFAGVVQQVAPLPDPIGRVEGAKKVYTTKVDFAGITPGLRPGMTALVEILVSERANVLTVPVKIIRQADGKTYVAVPEPDGKVDVREVTLGESNDQVVEVKKGLQSGERVSLFPLGETNDEVFREILRTKTLPK